MTAPRPNTPTLWGYIFMREEPAKDATALLRALERLTRDVGLTPAKMFVTTPHGRVGRARKFTYDWLREATGSAEAGSAYLSGAGRSKEELTVRFYLRYHHPIDMRFERAALHYAMLPVTEDAALRSRRVAALETFLLEASAPFVPLHGAIAAAVDLDEARNEVNMSVEARFGPDREPLPHRRLFDQRATDQLWTKARRVYWMTILGPELARAAGGVAAARAAGAARAELRQDCLIVQSTDEVADSLAFDWHARSRNLRRWLWPHTIQNPDDGPI